MRVKLITIAALAYGAVGVLVFGHAAANCTNAYDGFAGKKGEECPPDIAIAAGTVAGIAWPLYLSWSLFDGGAA